MSILVALLCLACVKTAAVAVLIVFAARQSRQNRLMKTHMSDAHEAVQRLEARIETVLTHCESDSWRVRCRLDRLETGTGTGS